MTSLLKELILPPGIFVLIGFYGIFLIGRNTVLAKRILVGVAVILYLFATPAVGNILMGMLPVHPPLTTNDITNLLADADNRPQAIVVLGAGSYAQAPEYGGIDTVNGGGLMRLRYGAHLYRLTALPILVTGGRPENTKLSESQTMANVLETDFKVPVRWNEGASNNTFESSFLSHEILAKEGINHIILVTHSTHMGRAVEAFNRVGFAVTPAPTAFGKKPRFHLKALLPTMGGLKTSRRALYEIIGRLWYRLRS